MPCFPVIQYVDDTLVVMKAFDRLLSILKDLLDSYAAALQVNFHESFLVPINVSNERIQIFTDTLHCQLVVSPLHSMDYPLVWQTKNGALFAID